LATRIERLSALVLVLALAGCGTEVELLYEAGPSESEHGFRCADGTKIVLGDATQRETARGCLGLECGSTTPGSATCTDPAMNRVHESCVTEFFSCFDPSGACTTGSGTPGTLSFDNGAKIAVPEGAMADGSIDLALFAAGSDTPCITSIRSTDSDGVFWTRIAD
jgi:hypothetical protein